MVGSSYTDLRIAVLIGIEWGMPMGFEAHEVDMRADAVAAGYGMAGLQSLTEN